MTKPYPCSWFSVSIFLHLIDKTFTRQADWTVPLSCQVDLLSKKLFGNSLPEVFIFSKSERKKNIATILDSEHGNTGLLQHVLHLHHSEKLQWKCSYSLLTWDLFIWKIVHKIAFLFVWAIVDLPQQGSGVLRPWCRLCYLNCWRFRLMYVCIERCSKLTTWGNLVPHGSTSVRNFIDE